ncbi:MAG: FdtA/QdtA family cupin domain-containing protein, partial [Bacteroidales bacterium]
EGNKQLPFNIARAYWIYDVPGGKERNGHAFRTQDEFIVALSGSFDIILNHGEKQETHHMSRSYYGLYIPRMTWREIRNFSTNSVALVISSTSYDEKDYIEDYSEYLKNIRK